MVFRGGFFGFLMRKTKRSQDPFWRIRQHQQKVNRTTPRANFYHIPYFQIFTLLVTIFFGYNSLLFLDDIHADRPAHLLTLWHYFFDQYSSVLSGMVVLLSVVCGSLLVSLRVQRLQIKRKEGVGCKISYWVGGTARRESFKLSQIQEIKIVKKTFANYHKFVVRLRTTSRNIQFFRERSLFMGKQRLVELRLALGLPVIQDFTQIECTREEGQQNYFD